MRRLEIAAVVLILLATARAENSSILGRWLTPTGEIIEVYRCDTNICARLIALGKQAPTHVDINNPDPSLRTHPLCGLQIGRGFHLTDGNHAENGQLYDPKSGWTYRGSMERDGDSLKLRGYVGIKLFGRTEVWKRMSGDVPACSA